MGVHQPRKYTAEFKRQAVELGQQLGSVSKAAEQLGIPEANIYGWQEKLRTGMPLVDSVGGARGSRSQPVGSPVLPGKESPEEELRRLRRENVDLKKANYILKAAAAFFSQDHLK